jgi:hypothetical protein
MEYFEVEALTPAGEWVCIGGGCLRAAFAIARMSGRFSTRLVRVR